MLLFVGCIVLVLLFFVVFVVLVIEEMVIVEGLVIVLDDGENDYSVMFIFVGIKM